MNIIHETIFSVLHGVILLRLICYHVLVPSGFDSMRSTRVSDSSFMTTSTASSLCLNSLAMFPGEGERGREGGEGREAEGGRWREEDRRRRKREGDKLDPATAFTITLHSVTHAHTHILHVHTSE